MDSLKLIIEHYGLDLNQRQWPLEIPDTNREDLAKLFAKLGYTEGAEIGTLEGEYAEMLLDNNPGLHLNCVDPYLAYKGYVEYRTQDRMNEFMANGLRRLEGKNYTLIRKKSSEAAQDFADNSLDFVFIDGNHEFRHVVNDIADWLPKIRKGGIMSGHDYIKRQDPKWGMGVVEAVQGYTSVYRIRPWFVLGTKEIIEGQKRDKNRSWFWIKT